MSIIELPVECNMDSDKYGHLRLDKELNIVSYTDYAKEFYGSIHHLNSFEQFEKDIRALSDSDAKNMAAIEQLCNQLKSGANSLDLTIKTSLLHKDHKMQKLRVRARYDTMNQRHFMYGIIMNMDANEEDVPYYMTPAGLDTFRLSMGVALYPNVGHTYKELFTIADKSLYIAKEKGKTLHVFGPAGASQRF